MESTAAHPVAEAYLKQFWIQQLRKAQKRSRSMQKSEPERILQIEAKMVAKRRDIIENADEILGEILQDEQENQSEESQTRCQRIVKAKEVLIELLRSKDDVFRTRDINSVLGSTIFQ